MKQSLLLVSLIICALSAPLLCPAVPGSEPTLPPDGTELGKQFRQFVNMKEKEVQKVAQSKTFDISPKINDFFDAVRSNQWLLAEETFMGLKNGARSQKNVGTMTLATGMQDVSGLYDLLGDWNTQLAELYIEEALRKLPKGSIVFGGTSEGRFFITYGADTLRNQQVTVVTQNALADNTYVDYLRCTLSPRTSIFSPQDSTAAFHEYVDDVKAGRRDSRGSLSFKNGRAKITGVHAVMGISGILVRRLVEQNHNTHSFYVEESYVLDWMYPYLMPHGLIMKLSKDPVTSLSMEQLKADHEYWENLESRLNSIPSFKKTEAARKAFSKCRCAIAGLYSFHDMKQQASAAFNQALRLYPESPETNFRFADHLKRRGQFSQAETVLTKYLTTNLSENHIARVRKYLEDLKNTKQANQHMDFTVKTPVD